MLSFSYITGIVLGGLAGFAAGQYLLLYIVRGEELRTLVQDRRKRVWLGTFGWFVALVGAWAGGQVGPHLARLAGY